MTSWTDYQDDISDAISDSMDVDWSANDGASAVVAWLNEHRPLSASPAPEGGAVLALGTPVEVEFSEAEVGKQTLYVAGVDMAEPGMPEPEYWLSETWPVKCRGDVSTDWKRDMFSALATREEATAEAGELSGAMSRLAEDAENEAGLGAGMLGGARIAADIRTVLSALRAQPPAREDAQPVAWFRRSKANPEAWYQIDPQDVDMHRRRGDEVQSIPAATHPALRVAVEALPDLTSVIAWLKNGCDAQHAATELGIYKARIDQALAALQAEQGER